MVEHDSRTLKRIQVAKGIHWVEVPEADLRILCGCPADTVKHLMKRGLVRPTERDGVRFETGPNAILLADTLLQNGDFCNMAEFPVLQMFYRQGMILPGHPGNSGVKPLLMGLREQVRSQIEYIHRGKFGLVSAREMMDAGATTAQAREMMALKLKYAYGSIPSPWEFLDHRMVGAGPVEVRHGVMVRRVSVNVFEFEYRGATAVVDLNLGPMDSYESPYPLGFHQVPREYFSIIHSGEGDGWDINRPSMGSILMFQGRIYLIDAGPNVQNTLLALGIGVHEVEGLFHTHCHDDHFAGLTNLIRTDRRLKYFATPLVRASVVRKLAALMAMEEERFERFFEVRDLSPDQWNPVNGLEVKPLFSPHPVETTILVFRALGENGYRSYAHFADIVALDVLQDLMGSDPVGDGMGADLLERVQRDYLTPADIKKVDVGGGMIHGRAEDFRADPSGRIILSHTNRPFTGREKEIGSGTTFGAVDVLIPTHLDYRLRTAHDLLRGCFPPARNHELEMLLNIPPRVFNPQTIMLKAGAIPECLHLILGGVVETIQGDGARGLLQAGALVGEVSGLFRVPAAQTFRTVGFVETLPIPLALYHAFVAGHDLLQGQERIMDVREVLLGTWLLGEGVSHPVLNDIARATGILLSEPGEEIPASGGTHIHLVTQGRLERVLGDTVFETLHVGDFFGEESAAFGTPPLFAIRTVASATLFEVPWEVLRGIPIVQWKVFETSEKRKRMILFRDSDSRPDLRWRDEFSVMVPDMDGHHRMLFEMAARQSAALEEGNGQEVARVLEFLISYTRFHFAAEEALLERWGYPGLDGHRRTHRKLMADVEQWRDRCEKREAFSGEFSGEEFAAFFRKWILDHILTEDRRYGEFINGCRQDAS
ncbi:MAG: bacteriohemerythrin [Magnetococcales bacterium]|nr:bacteriohemerythrin [Magnetococcales bacterium]